MKTQHFFGPFPVIDLGEIVLREIASRDADDYLDYMNRPVMHEFLTEDNIPKNYDKALEEVQYWGSLFSGKRSIYWGIALKDSDKLIGTAGFNHISFPHSRAELSYDLSPDYWGKGIMLKSIKAILKFADYELGIVRTQATVITTNDRSIKLLERCGFKKEGILEKYELVGDEYKDYYMYGRTY